MQRPRIDDPEQQRRFDRLVDALSRGDFDEEDLDADDWALLRDLYGEREDDLEDLLEQLRRLRAVER